MQPCRQFTGRAAATASERFYTRPSDHGVQGAGSVVVSRDLAMVTTRVQISASALLR